jgi:hypothetical protein
MIAKKMQNSGLENADPVGFHCSTNLMAVVGCIVNTPDPKAIATRASNLPVMMFSASRLRTRGPNERALTGFLPDGRSHIRLVKNHGKPIF